MNDLVEQRDARLSKQ